MSGNNNSLAFGTNNNWLDISKQPYFSPGLGTVSLSVNDDAVYGARKPGLSYLHDPDNMVNSYLPNSQYYQSRQASGTTPYQGPNSLITGKASPGYRTGWDESSEMGPGFGDVPNSDVPGPDGMLPARAFNNWQKFGMGMQGLASLGNLYNMYNQNKLMKRQLDLSLAGMNRDVANQAAITNRQISNQDRISAFMEGRDYIPEDSVQVDGSRIG